VATTAAFTLTLAMADPAAAQRGGANRQQGGPGPGGRFARMARPTPTLATVPVSAMVPYFGLTEEQAKKIEEIQKNARPNMEAMRSQIEGIRSQVGENPTQADRENIRARMMAMREEMAAQRQKEEENRDKAIKEIELVLTSEQRPAIASFLRDVDLFLQVNLPLELIRPLDLNGPQKRKLQQIAQQEEQEREQMMRQTFSTVFQQNRAQGGQGGNAGVPTDPAARQQLADQARQAGQQIGEAMRESREKTREKALAILTADQRALVVQWEKDHPRTQRGFGPGGQGGPGGPGGPGAFGTFPGNGG
jgi:Spy/CpxP family protein refolding chaperone